MHVTDQIVVLLYHQAACFGLSWLVAFFVSPRIRRGHWLISIAYMTVVQLAGAAIAWQLGAATPPLAWLLVLIPFSLAVIALTERWHAVAQACFATTISTSLLFFAYLAAITATSHLGPLSLVLAVTLLILQAGAVVLLIASSHEVLDVMGRIRWQRDRNPQPTIDHFPMVSLHVPTHNEPPEMVIETLNALARLDYPNYEVLVIDNNTYDEALWRPVEAHCQRLNFRFFHLENWPGFKSGALNYALEQTASEAEVVGVVDADYVVEPDYLRHCVGYFADSAVAFVQTPQDYREVSSADSFAVGCYYAYLYFFKISMASRNEHNGIIFVGTMGLIRKSALAALGGWDEWCITEDAELSLRVLDQGYRGVYLDVTYGRGLMPLNLDGLKKQRFRWAFGGMQILKRHWRSLLPWARKLDRSHRLTFVQKWDYINGALQWLNDPLTFGFTALLLLGTASLLVAQSLFLQPLASAVVVTPFLFIFIGVTRFLWALRWRAGCSLRDAMSAFVVLLGLTWTVTEACVLGLVKKEGVFLRTPKRRGALDAWHTLRLTSRETLIAAVCLAAAAALTWYAPRSAAIWAVVALLAWHGAVYSAALVTSLWSYASEARTAHPPYLARTSRTTGHRFSSMVTDQRVARGILAASIIGCLVFYIAVSIAPEEEQIFRANPHRGTTFADALIPTPPEVAVKAVLFFEQKAALHADTDAALRLWLPNAVIRDANYTLADESDDRIWRGQEEIRQRYIEEFSQRRYLSLAHTDASVFIEGNQATVVNDLRATIETSKGTQTVFLSRGDRWQFVKTESGWRIAALTLNRAPR